MILLLSWTCVERSCVFLLNSNNEAHSDWVPCDIFNIKNKNDINNKKNINKNINIKNNKNNNNNTIENKCNNNMNVNDGEDESVEHRKSE